MKNSETSTKLTLDKKTITVLNPSLEGVEDMKNRTTDSPTTRTITLKDGG